jgi:hypothetical protein
MNMMDEMQIEYALTHGLRKDGTHGPLASALVQAAIAMLEINAHTKCEWTAARTNAICHQIGTAIDRVVEKIDAEQAELAKKNHE